MSVPDVTRVRQDVAQQILLDAIRDQGGEWTTGRVKALYRKTLPTHVYRSTIRRHLNTLYAAGHLNRHHRNARRYFTLYELTCPRCGDTDGPWADDLCEDCLNGVPR